MSDFERIKLKYLANLYTGNSIPDDLKDKFTNKEIPYIPTKELDVTTGTINYENGLSVSPEDGFKIAPPFSTLMCIEGGSAGKKIGLTDRKVAFVNKLCCLKSEYIDDRLLYYCLQSKDFTDQFFLNMTGLIGGVSVATLKNLCITINRNSEYQVEIADKIELETDKIDNLIANQEAQIEKLKQYKQSLITEVVTKGLNPNVEMKDSELDWIVGSVPKHWIKTNPKALFKLRRDKALSTDRQLTASQNLGIIFQDEYMALTGQRVVTVEKDFDILKHVEAGDFVISMRSFQGGLEYSEDTGCISSAYVMLIPDLKYVYPKFYKWLFKSKLYINAIQSTSNLIRDGQAMRYSNFSQIWLYKIPIEEQIELADFLDEQCTKIDKLIEIKQSKIAKLNEYKKSLIYEYLTGKKEA